MFARTIALCSASLVAGIALILACGDDSPSDADAAAVCDCPEAEPPLAGRISVEEHVGTINTGNGAYGAAACDLVEGVQPLALSGGCKIVDGDIRQSGDLKLIESYENSEGGWTCTYDNASGQAIEVMITLTCLQPAPASN